MNYVFNFNNGKVEFNSGDTYNTNNSQVGAIGRNASGSPTFNNAPSDQSSTNL